MKGFEIILTPKDESGKERNREFYKKNKKGLAIGGKLTLEGDILKCRWNFPGIVPESMKNMVLANFTKQLDESILKKDNVSYAVNFF